MGHLIIIKCLDELEIRSEHPLVLVRVKFLGRIPGQKD